MEDKQQSKQSAPAGEGASPGKRAALRFVLVFLALVVGFQVVFFLLVTPSALFASYMSATASWTARALGWLGESAQARGDLLTGPGVALSLKVGCDGIQPASIFVAAVLAFPGAVRSKLVGLVLGIGVLQVFNIVRVGTLYYMSRDYPDRFKAFHETVLPTGLIILALVLWMIWVVLGTPKPAPRAG